MSTPKSVTFDPAADTFEADTSHAQTGEHRGGTVYVHDPRIVFAVQVAQKTSRPLLLQGPPGSGKSSLAPFVANVLRCRFYTFTVTARSQARDLMWHFDALGRLNDANVAGADEDARERVRNLQNYVAPHALWWTLDRATATTYGPDPATIDPAKPQGDPLAFENNHDVVLLIDEIDKADPDVPNNLLEVLGSRRFTVAETGQEISASKKQFPLIMITTNNERELPEAFRRRCITLQLAHKTPDELVDIAAQHFKNRKRRLYRPVAEKVEDLRLKAEEKRTRAPSTAEFLDVVRACMDLDVDPLSNDPTKQTRWHDLIEIGLHKPRSSSATDSFGAR